MDAAGLHFELYGPEGAPPLILSAGLGGAGAYWKPHLDALTREHRVILYDHRGTGSSARELPPTVSVDDLATDLLGVMHAAGIERAAIMGHAAGALAGLAIALDAPHRVSRLITVNGWAKADPHFLRCFDARLSLLRNDGPDAYIRAQPIFLFPAAWASANEARLEAEGAAQLTHFPGLEAMEKRVAALATFDIEAHLHEINVPVLAIAAKDDVLVPWTCSERIAARVKGAELALMAEGGHACNITEPETFERLVLDFLGRE